MAEGMRFERGVSVSSLPSDGSNGEREDLLVCCVDSRSAPGCGTPASTPSSQVAGSSGLLQQQGDAEATSLFRRLHSRPLAAAVTLALAAACLAALAASTVAAGLDAEDDGGIVGHGAGPAPRRLQAAAGKATNGAGATSAIQGVPSASDGSFLEGTAPPLMNLKPLDILERAKLYGDVADQDENEAASVATESALEPSADLLSASASNETGANETSADKGGWVEGTWTTGYWDCCKPSCSWSNKGHVRAPVQACDAQTGERLLSPDEPSVCQGGRAASCKDNQPFVVNERLSMGFAAAAVGGASGLTGDTNCGQCFELYFTGRKHLTGLSRWGGAHPWLTGRTMIVQVTNIGYDVTGTHSFDIQIPGAGQGIFDTGCVAQFPNYTVDDFDCKVRYGGCRFARGCKRLPKELQAGCLWRFEWYKWMSGLGRTNNPWVEFRRVQCPAHLTEISGSVPLDDAEFPAINISHFQTHPMERDHLVNLR